MPLRIDKPDQRGINAHQRRAAKPLDDARQRQGVQGVGKGAKQRGQGKDHQSALIHSAVAKHVAQKRKRQQGDDNSYLVGVDDPDRTGRRGIQIAGDGRQSDVRDRAIQHGHRNTDDNGRNCTIALR